MLITKFVTLKIGGKNIKHYNELGYNVKLFDVIIIPIEHLTNGSHVIVEVSCDYCGEKVNKVYKSLLNERKKSITKKDCCINCIHTKDVETNLFLYGVDNAMGRPEILEKMKEIIFKKFGVEYVSQNLEIKEKMSNSQKNMSSENKKIKREKTKNTMIERYGVDSPLKMPNTREKLFKTRSSQSSQQEIVFNILKKHYGELKVISNFFYSQLSLDILLYLDDKKIDIEYDSWYWHEPNRDRRRDEFLKSKGFYVIRIKSGKKIPDKNLLINVIEKLISSNYKYQEIILDDWNEEGYKERRAE